MPDVFHAGNINDFTAGFDYFRREDPERSSPIHKCQTDVRNTTPAILNH